MRNVICCWCDRNPEQFESHVPLYFAGRRNLKLGFSNNIDVLFLEGYDLLKDRYRDQLLEVGYRLHDVSGCYRATSQRYAALTRFGGYEMKCFLRWLVIASCFAGERIIHYDGDILFNEDPAVIEKLFQGKTFVLQGCPAVTCISDTEWLSQYQEQLDLFVKDPEAYSAPAWIEREGWEVSEGERWAGQRYRKLISSDQDLISHLIHTGRIVQDDPSVLLAELDRYMLFENPLYLHGYPPYCKEQPLTYERRSGIDFINGRQVLVWHMQYDFNQYLSAFIFRKEYLKGGLKRLPNHLVEKSLVHKLSSWCNRYLQGKTDLRLKVYHYFFEQHDFSEVLNDKTWWSKGAFV